MSDNNIRGASQIGDAEFLTAYNNKQLDNAGVLTELRTDWTAVGVKLRSPRLTLHTTVNRTGGSKGSFDVRAEPLAYEAQIWLKNGTIQQQPQGGGYVSLQDRINSGLITIDADLNVTSVAAPAPTEAPAVTTEGQPALTTGTTAAASTTQAAPEFAFEAEIFGNNYRMTGPTKNDALHALFVKLQELNFSKVMITNRNTGSTVGINDIQNGGRYKLAKQLTAAGHDDLVEKARAAIQEVFGDKTVSQGETAASLNSLRDEISTLIESLDVGEEG